MRDDILKALFRLLLQKFPRFPSCFFAGTKKDTSSVSDINIHGLLTANFGQRLLLRSFPYSLFALSRK